MLPTYFLLLVAGGDYRPPPMTTDNADRLPPLSVCAENAEFARKRLQYLQAFSSFVFRESEVSQINDLIADADARWWLWDAARMARDPKSGDQTRVSWLRYLKNNLTEGEWWSGELPPPVCPFDNH